MIPIENAKPDKEWLERCEKSLEELSKMNGKDRLDNYRDFLRTLVLLDFHIQAMNTVYGQPIIGCAIPDAVMKTMKERVGQITKDFLNTIDLPMTQLVPTASEEKIAQKDDKKTLKQMFT